MKNFGSKKQELNNFRRKKSWQQQIDVIRDKTTFRQCKEMLLKGTSIIISKKSFQNHRNYCARVSEFLLLSFNGRVSDNAKKPFFNCWLMRRPVRYVKICLLAIFVTGTFKQIRFWIIQWSKKKKIQFARKSQNVRRLIKIPHLSENPYLLKINLFKFIPSLRRQLSNQKL